MTVRTVDVRDISRLAEFWYDQIALRSQKQTAIRLVPNAQAEWEIYAQSLYDDDEAIFLLVEVKGEILGCIIGRVIDNEIGLLPRQIGLIEQLIIDLHSPHKRKNAVTELLDELKSHFRQNDISQIIVRSSTQSPVEQGFWRGLGLKHLKNTFWMDL